MRLSWWRRLVLAAFNRWVVAATYPIYLTFGPLGRPSADRDGQAINTALVFTRGDPLDYTVYEEGGEIPPHEILFQLAVTDEQVDRLRTVMNAYREGRLG